ncbi:Hsp20/alpha crystallin family protein [Patescibacteria group bacterium]
MFKNKKSFFERLTGSFNTDQEEEELEEIVNGDNQQEDNEEAVSPEANEPRPEDSGREEQEKILPESEETNDGQLTVDMYQTPDEIVIQTMVAGVEPGNLDISIAQDMITLKGQRRSERETNEDNYYYKELYWGNFSRSILLPQEVDGDNTKASFKNGLLVIRLPKINREKSQKIQVELS